MGVGTFDPKKYHALICEKGHASHTGDRFHHVTFNECGAHWRCGAFYGGDPKNSCNAKLVRIECPEWCVGEQDPPAVSVDKG